MIPATAFRPALAAELRRHLHGRTRIDVAVEMGLPASTVAAWFSGFRSPSVPQLAALADVLDADLHGVIDAALDRARGEVAA